MYQSDGKVKGEHDPNHPREWHRVEPTADGRFVFLHGRGAGLKPEPIGEPAAQDVVTSVVGVAHRYAQHGGKG